MVTSFKIKSVSKSGILKNIFLSFIFIFSFFLVFFSKSDYFVANKIKMFANDYINPISTIVSYPVKLISITKIQYKEFKNLKIENNILREEIMRLKKWQTLAIKNSRENKVLKTLMNSTDVSLTLIKTASVINRNDKFFAKIFNINTGIDDGVQKDMTVVNHRGLIGRVIDSSKNNSRVLLLTDTSSAISVKTISNNILSLIHGARDGKHLVSSFIKEDEMPKVGDLLVTSGSAQIFPEDILVGKIVKIFQNKFYVLPFVDFNNINYVQIVESK